MMMKSRYKKKLLKNYTVRALYNEHHKLRRATLNAKIVAVCSGIIIKKSTEKQIIIHTNSYVCSALIRISSFFLCFSFTEAICCCLLPHTGLFGRSMPVRLHLFLSLFSFYVKRLQFTVIAFVSL